MTAWLLNLAKLPKVSHNWYQTKSHCGHTRSGSVWLQPFAKTVAVAAECHSIRKFWLGKISSSLATALAELKCNYIEYVVDWYLKHCIYLLLWVRMDNLYLTWTHTHTRHNHQSTHPAFCFHNGLSSHQPWCEIGCDLTLQTWFTSNGRHTGLCGLLWMYFLPNSCTLARHRKCCETEETLSGQAMTTWS